MFKLTMVSYQFRGRRHTWFIPLPVGVNGQTYIPAELENKLIHKICPERGHTIVCG